MPRKSEALVGVLEQYIGREVEVRSDLPSLAGSGIVAGERGVVIGIGDWFDLRVDFGRNVRAVMLEEVKLVDGDLDG